MSMRCLRVFGVLLATQAVSGCGFHPLYAPAGKTQAGLSEVFVDVVVNRNGQLLRQALQERLQGSEEAPQQHYELSVSYNLRSQGIGIQQDNFSTRNRFVGSANWVLKKPGPFGQKITGGTVQALDGNDVILAQFFYSDLNSETVNRRIGEALADEIVQSLARYFRTHPELV